MKLCRSILSFKIFWNPSAEMKTDSNELPKTYSNIFWTSCYPNTYSGLLQFKLVSILGPNSTVQKIGVGQSWAKLDGLRGPFTSLKYRSVLTLKTLQWILLFQTPLIMQSIRVVIFDNVGHFLSRTSTHFKDLQSRDRLD